MPFTTSALELGEASIKSGLGQSLLVQIPYRLAGNERLLSACVGLAPAAYAADALPSYARVSRISITPTHIEIFDERSVVEPLIGLSVDVHCAGVPHFVRSYQLFVDPPAQIPTILSNVPAVADVAPSVSARPIDVTSAVSSETTNRAAATDPVTSAPVASPARATVSPRARGLAGGDLPQGQTYRVVRGDTLSGIAARVSGRPLTIRETADAIFAANPTAFTRGNPDLIEEGRSLTIPNLMASATALAAPSVPAPPAVRDADLPVAAPAAENPAPSNAAQPLQADAAASVAAAELTQPVTEPAPVVAPPSAAPVAAATPDVAPEAPAPATARFSAGFIALLVLGAVILLSASLAFVRWRGKQRAAEQAAEQARTKVQEPAKRRQIELPSRIDVVESSLTGTHAAKRTGSMPMPMPVAPSPPDPKAVALAVGTTEAVDFNVGAPVATNARAAVVDTRGPIIDAREDDVLEESDATARVPDIANDPTVRRPAPTSRPDESDQASDDRHALTIVELDMLRQDYEAEHTLTQQASQTLRDALADLAATKKTHAATAETATLESPQVSDAESVDSAAETLTARVRAK